MPYETIHDITRFAERCEEIGYAPAAAVVAAVVPILERGDDVILFTNHDLGSLSSRPLATVPVYDRDVETPPHAADGDYGPGWRYLPELRLTVPPAGRSLDEIHASIMGQDRHQERTH